MTYMADTVTGSSTTTLTNKTIRGDLTDGTANVIQLNQVSASPADMSTTNTGGVMSGFAISFTPRSTGRVLVLFACRAGNNNATLAGSRAQIRYGTGAAPVADDALVGTAAGNYSRFDSAVTNAVGPISCVALVTGLTVGTTYWFDASKSAFTAGTASFSLLSYAIVEI